MGYTVNIEQIDATWYAHVAELPGAYGSGPTVDAALGMVKPAILNFLVWSEAGTEFPLTPDYEVAEIHRAWDYAREYEVNAFFATDRPPLTEDELPWLRKLLLLARAELLDASLGLTLEQHDQPPVEGAWSVNDTLRHVASAENWYLDRLGLAHEPAWEMKDTLGRLILVRQHLLDVLPALVNDERLTEWNGELWTPRKVVRRALWHEREHALTVRSIRGQLLNEPG
jgi:predicted RNase H-like HicB family nuclease